MYGLHCRSALHVSSPEVSVFTLITKKAIL